MSAIDYAIHYKYPEAALAMVVHDERADEVLLLRSDKHPCVTLALIASMPRVFEAVQDKCITKANCKKDSKSFYVSFSTSPDALTVLLHSRSYLNKSQDLVEKDIFSISILELQ